MHVTIIGDFQHELGGNQHALYLWLDNLDSWYDAIFVCVDKLFKITRFMPTTTHVIVKGMARLFRDHVFKLHGLPKVILSDMDARFTSRF